MSKATAQAVQSVKEQLRVQPPQAAPDQKHPAWGYMFAREVLEEIAKDVPGFQYEWDEELVRFSFDYPEAQMALRPCEPVRMQVIKELLRIADLYQYLATYLSDCDKSDKEAECDHREKLTLEWLSGTVRDRFPEAKS